MKATGIVRRIDELGRVVIPKELRRTMSIENGDPIEFFVNGDTVVLRKYAPGCVICGENDASVGIFAGKQICRSCMAQIAQQAGLQHA